MDAHGDRSRPPAEVREAVCPPRDWTDIGRLRRVDKSSSEGAREEAGDDAEVVGVLPMPAILARDRLRWVRLPPVERGGRWTESVRRSVPLVLALGRGTRRVDKGREGLGVDD